MLTLHVEFRSFYFILLLLHCIVYIFHIDFTNFTNGRILENLQLSLDYGLNDCRNFNQLNVCFSITMS